MRSIAMRSLAEFAECFRTERRSRIGSTSEQDKTKSLITGSSSRGRRSGAHASQRLRWGGNGERAGELARGPSEPSDWRWLLRNYEHKQLIAALTKLHEVEGARRRRLVGRRAFPAELPAPVQERVGVEAGARRIRTRRLAAAAPGPHVLHPFSTSRSMGSMRSMGCHGADEYTRSKATSATLFAGRIPKERQSILELE
jgi:hypothetical protein